MFQQTFRKIFKQILSCFLSSTIPVLQDIAIIASSWPWQAQTMISVGSLQFFHSLPLHFTVISVSVLPLAIIEPQSECWLPPVIFCLTSFCGYQILLVLFTGISLTCNNFHSERFLLQDFVIYHLTIISFCFLASLPFNHPKCCLSYSNILLKNNYNCIPNNKCKVSLRYNLI